MRCSCGNTFTTRSTKPEIHLELCNECHPFFTGKQKLVDSGGRVERFQRRYAKTGPQEDGAAGVLTPGATTPAGPRAGRTPADPPGVGRGGTVTLPSPRVQRPLDAWELEQEYEAVLGELNDPNSRPTRSASRGVPAPPRAGGGRRMLAPARVGRVRPRDRPRDGHRLGRATSGSSPRPRWTGPRPTSTGSRRSSACSWCPGTPTPAAT